MTATAGGALDARVQALLALYREIAATRMHGLPLLNPVLQVQAVGFELVQPPHTGPAGAQGSIGAAAGATPALNRGAEVEAALGILITPWFMNLVWLPLQRLDRGAQVGSKAQRHVGQECFEFIAAHENGVGRYDACSLFSPVFEFQSQQAAVDTARAVLDTLRQPETATVPVPAAAPTQSPEVPQVPARRAFLFGRSAAAGQAARPPKVSGRG
jgi:[NiFe] hydrogenase assembly HybE family chaperone